MTSRTIQLTFFFAVFGMIAVLVFFIFKPFLNILVMSATFAVVFYPLYTKLLSRVAGKKHEGLAAFLTILIVMLIVFIPLTLLGTQVVHEATTLQEQIATANNNEVGILGKLAQSSNPIISKIRDQFEGFITQSTQDAGRLTQRLTDWLVRNYQDFFQSIASIALAIFLWFLSFYYFLRDGHRLKTVLVALSPLSDQYDNEILKNVATAVKSIVGGTLIVALVQGIFAGIGFAIFGVPSAAIWGALAVIAALVPLIGTALVTVPAIGYLFLIGANWPAIGLLIWSAIAVNGIDNILRPKLIQRGIRVHPFIILLSVVGGIAMFGPVGFLTGPIIISLFSEFLGMYRHLVLHQES